MVVQDGEKFMLSRNEDNYKRSGVKKSDGDNREDDDDHQPTHQAGRSRSGRRVT